MQTKVSKLTPDMIGRVVEVSVTDTDNATLTGMGRLSRVEIGRDKTYVFFEGADDASLQYSHNLTARIDAYDF